MDVSRTHRYRHPALPCSVVVQSSKALSELSITALPRLLMLLHQKIQIELSILGDIYSDHAWNGRKQPREVSYGICPIEYRTPHVIRGPVMTRDSDQGGEECRPSSSQEPLGERNGDAGVIGPPARIRLLFIVGRGLKAAIQLRVRELGHSRCRLQEGIDLIEVGQRLLHSDKHRRIIQRLSRKQIACARSTEPPRMLLHHHARCAMNLFVMSRDLRIDDDLIEISTIIRRPRVAHHRLLEALHRRHQLDQLDDACSPDGLLNQGPQARDHGIACAPPKPGEHTRLWRTAPRRGRNTRSVPRDQRPNRLQRSTERSSTILHGAKRTIAEPTGRARSGAAFMKKRNHQNDLMIHAPSRAPSVATLGRVVHTRIRSARLNDLPSPMRAPPLTSGQRAQRGAQERLSAA